MAIHCVLALLGVKPTQNSSEVIEIRRMRPSSSLAKMKAFGFDVKGFIAEDGNGTLQIHGDSYTIQLARYCVRFFDVVATPITINVSIIPKGGGVPFGVHRTMPSGQAWTATDPDHRIGVRVLPHFNYDRTVTMLLEFNTPEFKNAKAVWRMKLGNSVRYTFDKEGPLLLVSAEQFTRSQSEARWAVHRTEGYISIPSNTGRRRRRVATTQSSL